MQFLYYPVQFLIEQAARMQPDEFDPTWPRRRNLAVIPGRASSREPGIQQPGQASGFRVRTRKGARAPE